jgi:hypothetical protein
MDTHGNYPSYPTLQISSHWDSFKGTPRYLSFFNDFPFIIFLPMKSMMGLSHDFHENHSILLMFSQYNWDFPVMNTLFFPCFPCVPNFFPLKNWDFRRISRCFPQDLSLYVAVQVTQLHHCKGIRLACAKRRWLGYVPVICELYVSYIYIIYMIYI